MPLISFTEGSDMFIKTDKKRFIICAVRLLVMIAVFASVLVILDRILLLKSKDGI